MTIGTLPANAGVGSPRRRLLARAVAAFVVVTVAALLGRAPTHAQKARPPVAPPVPKPAPGTGEVNLTASSANVSEPGSPVKIQILRWSTDEERDAGRRRTESSHARTCRSCGDCGLGGRN